MWWARANGDLWLLAEYWYGIDDTTVESARRSIRERALAIEVNQSDEGYVLSDSTIQLVASDRAGTVMSRAFVWDYRTEATATTVNLLVNKDATASGLANLLANGKPERTIVDGCPAWTTTASNGDVVLGWRPNQDTWAVLSIPAALSRTAEAIVRGVREA